MAKNTKHMSKWTKDELLKEAETLNVDADIVSGASHKELVEIVKAAQTAPEEDLPALPKIKTPHDMSESELRAEAKRLGIIVNDELIHQLPDLIANFEAPQPSAESAACEAYHAAQMAAADAEGVAEGERVQAELQAAEKAAKNTSKKRK